MTCTKYLGIDSNHWSGGSFQPSQKGQAWAEALRPNYIGRLKGGRPISRELGDSFYTAGTDPTVDETSSVPQAGLY
ncbi:hypothetical protein CT0861_04285 [Colletotrichum tofieldiae]|uniref:Uncharacterized protein n=1 Tax=Colletotrichum tofieldiae TaxID=708197 RepID=A0A166UC19_9PEZI|nr:hypothetical protein CT0861_04285 [Colletotrichum tofieldiae]